MFRAQLVEKPDCTFQCVRDRIRGLDSHQSLQFSDKKNVPYEVNPRMVVFSHESRIGDNQVIMVLGIQAHGDNFVPSFSVK